MSLTAVENLADACVAALTWPGGVYNIADSGPYSRDDVVGRALDVPVMHVPVALFRALPTVTRYAADQLSDAMVLDIGKAIGLGYRPVRTFDDYLVCTTGER